MSWKCSNMLKCASYDSIISNAQTKVWRQRMNVCLCHMDLFPILGISSNNYEVSLFALWFTIHTVVKLFRLRSDCKILTPIRITLHEDGSQELAAVGTNPPAIDEESPRDAIGEEDEDTTIHPSPRDSVSVVSHHFPHDYCLHLASGKVDMWLIREQFSTNGWYHQAMPASFCLIVHSQ